MASTSSTNAAAGARTTSDRDERGPFFFFGAPATTLVALGRRSAVDAGRPRRALAHAEASGRP